MKDERDKTVVDLDSDEICTERKKKMNIMSSFPLAGSPAIKYCYFSQFAKIALKRIFQTITLVNVKLTICYLLTCKLNIITMCSVLNHFFVAFHI